MFWGGFEAVRMEEGNLLFDAAMIRGLMRLRGNQRNCLSLGRSLASYVV
jgi:hypothetical protein